MRIFKPIRYWIRYTTGDTTWDTGIVPPEIVELIESNRLAAGQAIDLGCGTGTTSIYLAQHGWNVRGIDLAGNAIRRASRKAREAGVEKLTTFRRGNVIREGERLPDNSVNLAVDIGCFHGLSTEKSHNYAAMLKRIMHTDGTFMLYSFIPSPERDSGFKPEQIDDLFTPEFRLEHNAFNPDTSSNHPSGWYHFIRE